MNAFARPPKPLLQIYWKYRLLQRQIRRRYSDSVTIETQQGIFKLPLDTDDLISRHLYARGEHELDWIRDSLAFLRRENLCPPQGQGTVLDVGANNGVISIGMLATGEFERAIAVEPDPRNYALLEGNVEANDFGERFTCLNVAASDQRTELAFELSEDNYGDHRIRSQRPDGNARELYNESNRRVIKVPADTIDNLLAGLKDDRARQVSLVWIDVQGYEGYAFRGATDLLSRGVPVVSEIWPYGIERAGLSQESYCEIVSGIWSTYWTEHRGTFSQHPISELPMYVAELGQGVKHKNVIFTA